MDKRMEIFKTALALIKARKILLVRKEGTDQFLMPGGKVELNESERESLKREIWEELKVELLQHSLRYYNTFIDQAAFEKNTLIKIAVYFGQVSGEPQPSSEIEEIRWFDKHYDPKVLSPIIRNKIIPTLVKDGYL